MRILLSAALFVLTGCAVHQPVSQNWRLLQRENVTVLVPPGVADAVTPQRTIAVDVMPGRGKCPPEIRAKGKGVVVHVAPDSLSKRPPGWLTAWADQVESQGCLAAGEAPKFAASVADALPLNPDVSFHLLHADDIEPPVRLQVVSPIIREGTPPDAPIVVEGSSNGLTVTLKAPNLVGYETALYDVQPKAAGAGFRIVPLYADRHGLDGVARTAAPERNYLRFPPDAAFYRLIIKSGQTDFTALVIAAHSQAELANEVAACDPGDRMCASIPKRVAINQVIPVTINEKELMVRWGANVAEAIRNSGEMRPEGLVAKLSVSRMFHGRATPVEFDRASPAILSLILSGGEVISW